MFSWKHVAALLILVAIAYVFDSTFPLIVCALIIFVLLACKALNLYTKFIKNRGN